MVRLSDVFIDWLEGSTVCVRLCGAWLNRFGFTLGRKVSIEVTKGQIVIRLIDTGDYTGVLHLSEVFPGWLEDNAVCVSVCGAWLGNFGFTAGRKVFIEAAKGQITVRLIDAEDFMGIVYMDYEEV